MGATGLLSAPTGTIDEYWAEATIPTTPATAERSTAAASAPRAASSVACQTSSAFCSAAPRGPKFVDTDARAAPTRVPSVETTAALGPLVPRSIVRMCWSVMSYAPHARRNDRTPADPTPCWLPMRTRALRLVRQHLLARRLGCECGEPVAEGFTGREHVRLHGVERGVRVAARHRIEQRGVLAPAALLLLRKELEVVAGHDPHGLAKIRQQPGRAGRQVD